MSIILQQMQGHYKELTKKQGQGILAVPDQPLANIISSLEHAVFFED